MNFDLDFEGFEKYLVYSCSHPFGEGKRYVFRFENGYGASIVKFYVERLGFTSLGYCWDEWELAVIRFVEDSYEGHAHLIPGGKYVLYYRTPITDDVACGTDKEIRDLLKRIKEL